MRMRIAILMVAVIAGLVACTPVQPTPVPVPGNTTVSVVVNVGNGSPSASPSPGANGQIVFGSKIGEFGERGPNAAANSPRETRVGNVSDVTCSPVDAGGQVIKNGNPSQLVYFKQLGGSGAGVFDQGEDNLYNGTVTCKTTGVVVLECSLRDTATGTVVTGGNSGAREDSPWTMNCVS